MKLSERAGERFPLDANKWPVTAALRNAFVIL